MEAGRGIMRHYCASARWKL